MEKNKENHKQDLFLSPLKQVKHFSDEIQKEMLKVF